MILPVPSGITSLDIITPSDDVLWGAYFKKIGENTYLFINRVALIFQFYTGVTSTDFGVNLTSNKVPPTPNRVAVDAGILSAINRYYPISGLNVIPGFTAQTSNITYYNCPYTSP